MIDRAAFATLAAALGGDVKPDKYGTPVLRFQRDGKEIAVRPAGLRAAPETVMHVSTPATPAGVVSLAPRSKPRWLRALVDRANLAGDPDFDNHVELRYGFDRGKVIRTLLRDAKARKAIVDLLALGYGSVSFERDAIQAVWNERPVEEALSAELLTRTAELLRAIADGVPSAGERPPRRRMRAESWAIALIVVVSTVGYLPFNLPSRIWLWPCVVGLVTAAIVGAFLSLRTYVRSERFGYAFYFRGVAPTLVIAGLVFALLTGVSWLVAR